MLCEAAQTAKRHPDFAASYQAIARRRGKKIATTAIARKLLARAWHLLTDAAAPPHRQAIRRPPRAPRSQTGGVAKPRASSQYRHEPATPRSMT